MGWDLRLLKNIRPIKKIVLHIFLYADIYIYASSVYNIIINIFTEKKPADHPHTQIKN